MSVSLIPTILRFRLEKSFFKLDSQNIQIALPVSVNPKNVLLQMCQMKNAALQAAMQSRCNLFLHQMV